MSDNLPPYPNVTVVDPDSARNYAQLHAADVIQYLKKFLGATEVFVTMSGDVWMELPRDVDGYIEKRYLADKDLSELMTAMKEEKHLHCSMRIDLP
jgi:hypothetical protein